MDTTYQHNLYEKNIYQQWETSGAFQPSGKNKKTFTIIMPPPNANDPLHIGHAIGAALEDALIRYHRMLGEDTLWLPGTDHAGIETQFVFEKKLKKDGKSRFQFDRETLYNMIWEYVQENSQVAMEQMKRLGASADWSRLTFTLDPKVVRVILHTFEKLNHDGLIYRDLRLVNYCTRCGTAFSELEVKHVEEVVPLYYMKYGPFTIATVRPETKFRDEALAVNPKDPRYQEWLGKKVTIDGLLGPIEMTVVGDENVDPEFGTGIMKVTPAHDPHDFELGQKYGLQVRPIIDFQGRMDFGWYLNQPNTLEKYRERAQKYHGKKVAEMRKLMAEDLAADDLLVKIDPNYHHTVGTCYRCGSVLEPLPLPQFFVKVRPLADRVLKELAAGKVPILGAGHDKILTHWLTTLKDWNISRQIVWGIRIPVWYSITENPTLLVSFLGRNQQLITGQIGELMQKNPTILEDVQKGLQSVRAPVDATYTISQESPGEDYIQETDTFDTWFGSTQWPFATLKTTRPEDFDRFYPTQVMETAYDILPFWVMRMLFMGLFATDQLPFTTVYFHGLIRDAKGQKMSKSKGNVINPLEIIDKYGADALRMALVIRSSPGLDKAVGESDFRAMRNFTNKVWNAARFIHLQKNTPEEKDAAQTLAFKEHLSGVVQQVTQQLNDLRLGLAAETIYTEFWHWFCDQCIEQTKHGELDWDTLRFGLIVFLRLLHPFMPFVTEAIWQELDGESENHQLLIQSPWPKS